MTKIVEEIVTKEKQRGKVVIRFTNVGKKYLVHHEKPTLAENLTRVLKFEKNEEYWAVRNLNLEIRKGERIGLYGPNGSGKTTILKLIAGISTPTEGSIATIGRIISLVDIEAGFHPDLSGQENIILNGLVLGMSREEVRSKVTQIITFADIGNYITAPLYTYSSGMKLRLGFSVAIHANPSILLLDEVVNMGDANFRDKSHRALKSLYKKKVTVIMVSQWLPYLKDNTQKILSIQN